jgi:hypothetical protein
MTRSVTPRMCAAVVGEYIDGELVQDIAARYDHLTIWDVDVFRGAHGVPHRYAQGLEQKVTAEHIREHWRTVHDQEPPEADPR